MANRPMDQPTISTGILAHVLPLQAVRQKQVVVGHR
jgi:hypothetical protein